MLMVTISNASHALAFKSIRLKQRRQLPFLMCGVITLMPVFIWKFIEIFSQPDLSWTENWYLQVLSYTPIFAVAILVYSLNEVKAWEPCVLHYNLAAWLRTFSKDLCSTSEVNWFDFCKHAAFPMLHNIRKFHFLLSLCTNNIRQVFLLFYFSNILSCSSQCELSVNDECEIGLIITSIEVSLRQCDCA